MNDQLLYALEMASAAVSVLLMGVCGVRLLLRFCRVLRGKEPADGLTKPIRFAPITALAAAAGIALLSRLMLYVLAYAMYRLAGGGMSLIGSLEPLWTHWDAQHYLGIARDGYAAVGDERLRLVFFPLYPALMRLLAPAAGGSYFCSGVLISLSCASLAAALLYDLAYMHGGRRIAVLATAYFLLNPLSVFLCCVYTESLFICLTLLAICLLRRGRPYAAAVCGMLSALTRMPGVIVCGLMIIALLAKLPQRRLTLRAAVGCAVQVFIVFCGLFIYWLINDLVTGDPFTYLIYQKENWFQEAGSFWQSTANTVHYLVDAFGEDDWLFSWFAQFAAMMAVYLLLALRAQDLPFDLAAYSFVYVAVVLSPTWLLSAPRYLYAMAPLPLLLARLPMGRRGHAWLLSVSALLLALWVYGYAIVFMVL